MKNIFVLLFFCSASSLFSQVGVNATYQKSNQISTFTETEYSIEGFAIGVDYWFRLANRRLEFTPELNYSKTNTSNILINENRGLFTLDKTTFSFYFNTNFYIFDFESDCNCPTFEKDGNFIKKGFFLQLSPGVSYHDLTYTEGGVLPELRVVEDNIFSYSAGGGVGIDIGISEHLTITPFAKARYHLTAEIDGTIDGIQDPELAHEFSLWQYNFGLGLRYFFTDEYSRNKRMRNKREAKSMKKKKW